MQTDSASVPKADATRSINEWYRETDHLIWNSDRVWDYDDSNYTTLPNATRDLVANQDDYELPSTAKRIKDVEIKKSDGNWVRLVQYDIDALKKAGIAYDEFEETAGVPLYYDLVGRSVIIRPKPAAGDITSTEGLRIFVGRDVITFSSSATTRQPGFDENYHRILSLGAAQDNLIATDADNVKLARIQRLIDRYTENIKSFYGARNLDNPARIDPSSNSYHRNYT